MLVSMNPFQISFSFLHAMTTQKNPEVFYVFRRYGNGTLA